MKIQIHQQDEATEIALREPELRLGGGEGDGIHVPGVLPGLLTLQQDGQRLVLEAVAPLAIDGILCPPHVARLLLPDETVELAPGVTMRVLTPPKAAPPPTGGTVALLRGFIGDAAEPAPSNAATLTCLTGLDMGRVFPLSDGPNELGRGEQVAVRIRDRAVSRRHARVVLGPDGCVLEDLGAPNGLYVNGQKLEARRTLAGGDVLELGHSLLRFTAPTWPPAPKPEPEPPPEEHPLEPAPPRDAPPAVPEPAPRTPRWEWLLVLAGAALAMVGALVTWGLLR